MSFTENLKVLIETQLDEGAFKELRLQLAMAKAAMSQIASPLEEGKGFAQLIGQAEVLEDKLAQVNLQPRGGEGQAPFTDTETGAPVSENQARQRAFRREMEKSKVAAAKLSDNVDEVSFSSQLNRMQAANQVMNSTLSDAQEIETPQIDANIGQDSGTSFAGESLRQAGLSMQAEGPTRMEKSLQDVKRQATPAARSISNVGGRMDRLYEAFEIAKIRASNFDGSIRNMIPSLQSLQMTLLGVQFQLLSLAFIFGGLMMSALGAVGIFQILGNTLKMFFLPTALELLPVVLDLRNSILDVGEGTRKTIGRIFAGIAAFAALGSLLAFVTNGFLSVLTVVKGIFAPLGGLISLINIFTGSNMGLVSSLGTLLKFFSSAGSTAAGFSGTMGVLSSAAATLGTYLSMAASAIMGLAPPVLIAIGVLISLWTVFQRFPGIAKAVMNIISGLLNFFGAYFGTILENITSIVSGIINVITGLTTAIVAFLTGDMEKAKKGFAEALFGIGQIFVDPFVNALNFLTQTLLPAITDFARKIPKAIINAIMNIGGVFSDALKSVLPDWLWDLVSGHLDTAAGIGKTAKDILDMPNELVSGIDPIEAPQIGQDFKPTKDKTGGQDKKQQSVQNNISVFTDVNDKEETPQETGRKIGQGLSTELENQSSSIFSSGT